MLRNFGTNPQYRAMFARAGLPVAEDGAPSDALIDATVVYGNEAALTDRLGELAESQDELLVTLQPTTHTPSMRQEEEDVLFRALTHATGLD
jgi:hypothetical protein